MSQTTTMRADELIIGHNIYRDGYIYTISDITPDGDDLIFKVISPRVVEAGLAPVVTQYRWHHRRPITVYT